MTIPRSEYPRPQMVRDEWLCLNGEWEFEVDAGDSGLERGLCERPLAERITVPFCPESRLSGLERTDFLNAVWYRREAAIPAGWAGRKVLLHFQAVDYDTTVWVNGVQVAEHRGGFTPFTCDLGGVVEAGQTAVIVVRARDRKGQLKPGGKQSWEYANRACCYTRTTGVWQTVWMEPVAEIHLGRPKIFPDVAAGCFRLTQPVTNSRRGCTLRAILRDAAGEVVRTETAADADFTPQVSLEIPEDRRRLWSPSDPHLYDLDIELLDAAGAVIDRVASYAGLRSVVIDGAAVKINGEPIFQRLVLDQGYYPDGLMTAPSEEALVADIRLAMDAGFNGARLHQKVFEERFLYHADRLGYLVWGEFGDWNADVSTASTTFVTQWIEAVERDLSHPAIVGWCPLNETQRKDDDEIDDLDDATRGMFLATKLADPSRPVLDVSGFSHRLRESDVFDSHDYEQNPEAFAAKQACLVETGRPWVNPPFPCAPYNGQPFFVSEFGGVWWNPAAVARGETSWGYGQRCKDIEEFYHRFEGLCAVLLDNPRMFGYCYTQLTDVFQEQNGVYTFERGVKFDMARLRAAQQRPAAVETVGEQG